MHRNQWPGLKIQFLVTMKGMVLVGQLHIHPCFQNVADFKARPAPPGLQRLLTEFNFACSQSRWQKTKSLLVLGGKARAGEGRQQAHGSQPAPGEGSNAPASITQPQAPSQAQHRIPAGGQPGEHPWHRAAMQVCPQNPPALTSPLPEPHAAASRAGSCCQGAAARAEPT